MNRNPHIPRWVWAAISLFNAMLFLSIRHFWSGVYARIMIMCGPHDAISGASGQQHVP